MLGETTPVRRPSTETLRLVHEDLVRERDRLRDARRAVTAQLGPLPAASAVVVGLFGALSNDVHGPVLTSMFGIAVAIFVVIVWLSSRAIGRSPYRLKRVQALGKRGERLPEYLAKSEDEWLLAMIDLERSSFYGTRRKDGTWTESSQDDFDAERKSLLRVQTLFAVQVILLGLMVGMASWNR